MSRQDKSFKMPDRRAIEKMTVDIARAMGEREFASAEEADEYLRDLQASGDLGKIAPRNAIERAQDVMYEAFDQEDPKKRVALAGKALKISTDCADAYSILAEETAETEEERLKLYEQGTAAGERALGSEYFKENAGHFWGQVESRPYMRARAELARCLWTLGERGKAIEHYRDMLRLNTHDNQGIRYLLVACLGQEGRLGEVEELLEREDYKDDSGLDWLMMKTLTAFAREGESAAARGCLREALDQNEYLAEVLTGDLELPEELPDAVTMGGEDEAASCVAAVMPAWERVPGAINWLAREFARLNTPKAGRNDRCPCDSGKKYKKCCGA